MVEDPLAWCRAALQDAGSWADQSGVSHRDLTAAEEAALLAAEQAWADELLAGEPPVLGDTVAADRPGTCPTAPGGAGVWRDADIDALDDYDLVAAIAGAEATVAMAQAGQQQLMAALVARSVFTRAEAAVTTRANRRREDTPADREHRAAVEISAALTIAPRTATMRLDTALVLVHDFPDTLAMVSTGAITLAHARAVHEETRNLPTTALRKRVEGKALAALRARRHTVGQLRRKLAGWVIAADPAGAEDRHRRAKAARAFGITPGYDGMCQQSAELTAEAAQIVFAAVDGIAATLAQTHTDTTGPTGARPGVAQLRADALVLICRHVLHAGHTGCAAAHCGEGCTRITVRPGNAAPDSGPDTTAGGDGSAENNSPSDNRAAAGHAGSAPEDPPGRRRVRATRRHGHRPHIQVTVALSTLLGIDQLPAQLAGHGPITAETARRIATHGDWRRLITDPIDGRLLEYGRALRDPPQDLEDYLIARDVTDRFPTSLTPANRCDLDHRREWERGGTTGQTNMHALGNGLHVVRHDVGWRIESPREGHLIWTSPTGHRYYTHPEQIGPTALPETAVTLHDNPDGQHPHTRQDQTAHTDTDTDSDSDSDSDNDSQNPRPDYGPPPF